VTENHDHRQSGLTTAKKPDEGPLPRAVRRRKRAKEDRGLPPDKEIFQLASSYLEVQRKNWRQLADYGLLPEPTPSVLQEMVDDFKQRHRTGLVNPDQIAAIERLFVNLGGTYSRYSWDNSKPFVKTPNSGALRWCGILWVYGDLCYPEGFAFGVEVKNDDEVSLDGQLGRRSAPYGTGQVADW
jgi:hypothetical protein